MRGAGLGRDSLTGHWVGSRGGGSPEPEVVLGLSGCVLGGDDADTGSLELVVLTSSCFCSHSPEAAPRPGPLLSLQGSGSFGSADLGGTALPANAQIVSSPASCESQERRPSFCLLTPSSFPWNE